MHASGTLPGQGTVARLLLLLSLSRNHVAAPEERANSQDAGRLRLVGHYILLGAFRTEHWID